ncbi:MAG: hypothetical protein IJ794_09940 [Lachnospiraceae bacterium]|nr:hypothetical protein [Lachnospiraceae bacterium]
MKKKIFALSFAAVILGMTAACTTARNDGANTGTLAENGVQEETNALSNLGTDGTMTNTNYNNATTDTNRINTTKYNTDQTVTEADNLNGSNNGVIMDNADEVVGGAVRDAARGVTDVAEDIVDGTRDAAGEDNATRETGISGTDTMR